MWEKQQFDGCKKLKSSAVLTIFGELVKQQERQEIINTPTIFIEIEEEVIISILIVSANKEVEILQSEPEITRSPAANVSDKKQTMLNTQTCSFENYGPDATKNKILHEETHIVMGETKGKTEHESTTSGKQI
ncbi:PREDICTED: uncharacterized protein LOC105461617 [Wasmannia auropunctata]|uniref:uncharacterized protein LOC105461617 n=1 Tax=Wasmannia auropunctata TaxID=64793 RepID=UPI0005EFEABE|nr:PREDICTED: uncharacterized protein LOC105461617 [Wasmannia auropunctata]